MQTDRQIDRQIETGDYFFSYCRGHETSRKHKSGNWSDELDYYTSLAYAQEVKSNKNRRERDKLGANYQNPI